ncbi:hypothetical protein TRIUR3_30086 [Triticum urartu]|uniref:Uncharacterized protein n=1 Tax=Triticum urartu TaxID=4572 RepID=M7YGX0_TRIUA|nr:hypothetical protein TRIUR3_30086 [Triticum urartu]
MVVMLGVHGEASRQAGNEARPTGPGGRQERFETAAARQGAAERHGTGTAPASRGVRRAAEQQRQRRTWRREKGMGREALVVQGQSGSALAQVVDGEGPWHSDEEVVE